MAINRATLGRNMLAHLRSTHSKLQDLSARLSSGKKINTVSDDVAGASRVMRLRQNSSLLQSRLQNARRGNTALGRAVSTLQQISDSLGRARQLASQAANETYDGSQRAAMAAEINSILEQSVTAVADARGAGEYLFSGKKSQMSPYDVTRGPQERIQKVTYRGASVPARASIGGNETVQMNFVAPRMVNRSGELFETLADLRDAVRNGNQAAIDKGIGRLKEAARGLRTSLSTLGARKRQLQNYQEFLRSAADQNEKLISREQDTDFARAAMKYRQQLTALKSVLKLATRRSRISLANYI